jgi:hypothetical protein
MRQLHDNMKEGVQVQKIPNWFSLWGVLDEHYSQITLLIMR